MAQSFLVNSAVRLHPVEFSIGQAAGVVGVYAIQNKIESVAQILAEQHIKHVESRGHVIRMTKCFFYVVGYGIMYNIVLRPIEDLFHFRLNNIRKTEKTMKRSGIGE